MALKELIIDLDQVTEEIVENVVKGYLRYDPVRKITIFASAGKILNGKQKVLLYLVGELGWRYILDGNEGGLPVPEKSPSEISVATGIKGNTVRPILMTLLKQGLIHARNGKYTVLPESLPQIIDVLKGGKDEE